MTPVCQVENCKRSREEVNVLSSYKFPEVSSLRDHLQGKLKEYLQQVGFQWSYSHDELIPGEFSQQQVLVKSQIPTPDQISKVDKEAKTKKSH
jgi:hypothetical protein